MAQCIIIYLIGLIRQPKYGHLKELHRAVKLCEKALISADPTMTSLGNLQQVSTRYCLSSSEFTFFSFLLFYYFFFFWEQFAERLTFFQAHVYTSETGGCAAFLSNFDTKSAARVMFNNMHYNLPPWSISILPDCRNVVFNTAKVRDISIIHSKILCMPTFSTVLQNIIIHISFCLSESQVGVQTSQMEMVPTNNEILAWETYNEDLSSLDDSSTFSTVGLLEQINVTRDATDYLWYTTR